MIMTNRHFLYFVFLVFLTLIGCSPEPERNEKSTKDIYQSYRTEGIGEAFSIPPGLVSIFLDESKPGNAELKYLLEDIKHLNFLVVPNSTSVKDNEYFKDISTRLNSIDFQDLASINNGNEQIAVKILPSDSVNIQEMVVLVSNTQTLFCVSFQGDISLQKVANLTKPENIEVISNLKRLSR